MSVKRKMEEEDKYKKRKATESDRRSSYPNNYQHHPPPPHNSNPKSPSIEADNNYPFKYYTDTKARMPPIIQPEPPSKQPEFNREALFGREEDKKDVDILGYLQSSNKKQDYKDGDNLRKKIH